MSLVARTVGIYPPRSLVIGVVAQTLQISWTPPIEYTGSVSYVVYVDGSAVSTQAGLTYTTTSLTNGSHSVDVYATDSRGFASVALSGSASVVAAATTYKWHPANYLATNTFCFRNDSGSRANRRAVFDLLANNPLFEGCCIYIPWGSIEFAQGQYDFSEVDSDLSYLRNMGKRLIVEPHWQKFAVPALAPDTRFFPQYIYDAGGVFNTGVGGANLINLNNPTWAQRYIALAVAFAQHYDGVADVEMFKITEFANLTCSQLKVIITGVSAAFTSTPTVFGGNYFDTFSPRDVLAHLFQNKMGIGGPDMIGPPGIPWQDFGSRAFQGLGTTYLYEPGDGGSLDCGTTDYRTNGTTPAKIPSSWSYQALGGVPVSGVSSYQRNTLRQSHPIWTVDFGHSAGTNYDDGILPFVQSTNGTLAAGANLYPSCYG